MDLQELRSGLDVFIDKLSVTDKEALLLELHDIANIYPFNEYEYIISNLLSKDVLLLNEYQQIRNSYISQNMYLPIIEIA